VGAACTRRIDGLMHMSVCVCVCVCVYIYMRYGNKETGFML